jgi:hypothetical protein
MHNISSNAKFPIQDTGATDTFFRISDSKFLSDVKPGGGLIVGLPNGTAIRSIATGKLNTPPINTLVHIFSDDHLERSLNSTSDYCNQGCTAIFTATSMLIVHDSSGMIVASSTKLSTDKLWPSFCQDLSSETMSPTANIMVRHEINADFVAYTHSCFGSPPDSSMLRALKTGYLDNVDRITAKCSPTTCQMPSPQPRATSTNHGRASNQQASGAHHHRSQHLKTHTTTPTSAPSSMNKSPLSRLSRPMKTLLI